MLKNYNDGYVCCRLKNTLKATRQLLDLSSSIRNFQFSTLNTMWPLVNQW